MTKLRQNIANESSDQRKYNGIKTSGDQWRKIIFGEPLETDKNNVQKDR